jgi:hypothetical protein
VLIAGSTLMIGGRAACPMREAKALPGTRQHLRHVRLWATRSVAVEQYYKYNLTLEVTPHNRVRFELPRGGQGARASRPRSR